MIYAVIPAAGKSTRMGGPKLALPIGDCTVLEHVIATLRQAGVEHILVVVAPHASDLVPRAEAAGAQVLLLAEATPDMRATVEKGLCWLEERFHPHSDDSWLLVPADHPALSGIIVKQLIAARAASPHHSIVIPTFEGKRGHPALIDWKHYSAIKRHPPRLGLNGYLREQEDEAQLLPVESEGVLWDLDTPEDYARLRW